MNVKMYKSLVIIQRSNVSLMLAIVGKRSLMKVNNYVWQKIVRTSMLGKFPGSKTGDHRCKGEVFH